jgi:hypothetical protein
MWMDAEASLTYDQDEAHVPPAYLANPKVQEGILGWLGLQRCQEEESRLLAEIEGLLSWMSSQIKAINNTLSNCEGLPLPFSLNHNCSSCFLDRALTFQLPTLLQTHLTMGTKWMHDLGSLIDFSKWPKKKQKEWEDDYEEAEEADNSGGSSTHQVIEDLELDDQHAQFLDVANLQEENEVEKLLGKVAERCEEWAVDFSGIQEDIVTLFN